MLRIDRLDTTGVGHLGAHQIRDLSAFDLIVIHGPNGCGKTTLASMATSPHRGTQVADPATGRVLAFDHSLPCQVQLLARSSLQLMAPFESPESALRAAAGLERLRQQEALLRTLLGERANSRFGLKPKLCPMTVAQTPAPVAQAVDDYLTADRALTPAQGSLPLVSLPSFNALAHNLANLRSVPHQPVTRVEVSDLARVVEQLTPRVAQQPGMAEVSGAVQRLAAAMPTETLDASEAQLSTAERACQDTVDSATTLLQPHRHPKQTDDLSGWTSACLTLGDELKRESAGLRATLARRDEERELRRQARTLLEHGHDRDACPVCQHQQPREALVRTLDALLSSPDPGTAEAQERLARCQTEESAARRLAMRLEEVSEARKAASARVDRERAGWVNACREAITALQPNDGWSSRIREVAELVRQRCQEASAADARACRKAMSALREHATQAAQTLRTEDQNMHRSHEHALRLHEELRLLGRSLLRRAALNALPWPCTWNQEAGRAARLEVVERWLRAVNRVIEGLRARMHNATSEIVAKPSVRILFERLISSLRHPLLPVGTAVGASSVQLPGSDAPLDTADSLSEGYRVLVNVAAFIALASGAQGHPGHACGWIVLDEPTNGLDPHHRDVVAEYLGGLSNTDMPCQIIVTTFDDQFVTGLVHAARRSGRRCKVLELPAWPMVQTQGIRERSS